jgi:hypothetical protein
VRCRLTTGVYKRVLHDARTNKWVRSISLCVCMVYFGEYDAASAKSTSIVPKELVSWSTRCGASNKIYTEIIFGESTCRRRRTETRGKHERDKMEIWKIGLLGIHKYSCIYYITYIPYALQIPCFMRMSNEGLYNVVDLITLDKSFEFLSHEVETALLSTLLTNWDNYMEMPGAFLWE